MQIDWGDLEASEGTAEIDWDRIGQLDASEILVVEDSVEGQTSSEPGHIVNHQIVIIVLLFSPYRSVQ